MDCFLNIRRVQFHAWRHTPLLSVFSRRLGELLLCRQRAHLVVVSLRRVELADGPNVVGGVAGDSDVPIAFEDDLDVLDVESIGTTKLGHLAGGGRNRVNKLVNELKDGLWVGTHVSQVATQNGGVQDRIVPLRHRGQAFRRGQSA